MAHPAETPHFSESDPEPQPDSEQSIYVPNSNDLTIIAEHLGRGSDYVASFTSFLASDLFSLDKALQMLGLKSVEDVQNKLQEIASRQAEIIQTNVNTARRFGRKAVDVTVALNPLRYINRK